MSNDKVNFSSGQLSQMSDDQICSLFHSDNWSKIDSYTRLNLCQEVENRCAANDNVNPRTVVPEKMNGASYGYQQGNIIAINEDMLFNDMFRTTFTDENGNQITTEHAVTAPGWNTLDTLVHEHTHGVNMDKGISSSVYISPESDYDLYRIQTEEKNAYDNGQNSTKAAISRAEEILNKVDSEKEMYLKSVENYSYFKALENAKLNYNDPFIDKTLAQFISDKENGIERQDPHPSYQAISNIYDQQLQREFEQLLQSKETLNETQINNAVENAQNNTSQILENTQPQNADMQHNDASYDDNTINTEHADNSISSENGNDKESEHAINNDTGTGYSNDGSSEYNNNTDIDYSNDGSIEYDNSISTDHSNDGSSEYYNNTDIDYSNDGSIEYDNSISTDHSNDGSVEYDNDTGIDISNDGGIDFDIDNGIDYDNDGSTDYDNDGSMDSGSDGGMDSGSDGGMDSGDDGSDV